MRNINYLITGLAAAGIMLSCNKEAGIQNPDNNELGASVVIELATRADAPGTTGLADGGQMEDLYVVSVSTTGGQRKVDGFKEVNLSSPAPTTSVSLDGLNFGPHEIYLFANTRGFDNVAPGLISGVKALAIGSSFTYADEVFTPLTAGNTPQISNGVMPLTASLKDINLGVGETKLSAELIRPFVKLTVNVYNEAEQTLNVSGVTFNNFNPSTAYVFDHFVDSATEYTPASLTYVAMPSSGSTIEIPSRTEVAVYEGLIYEGRLSKHESDTYRVSLDFQLGTRIKSAPDLVFKQINENREASPMLRMLRNNHVVITIFVGYYDNPVEDFTYDVAAWSQSVNNITFE